MKWGVAACLVFCCGVLPAQQRKAGYARAEKFRLLDDLAESMEKLGRHVEKRYY